MAQVNCDVKACAEQSQHLAAGSPPCLARGIIEHTSLGVLVTDADRRAILVNPAFTAITGFAAEDVLGHQPGLLRSGRHHAGLYRRIWRSLVSDGRWQGELWGRRKDGELFRQRLKIDVIRDPEGQITNYIGIFSALAEVEQSLHQLYRLTWHDALTDLPNRQLFLERLEMALQDAIEDGGMVGLLHLNLDRFKEVNTCLGHDSGDRVLVLFARFLADLLRSSDTVARIGSDEFTVIIHDMQQPGDAMWLARQIQQALDTRPFNHAGHELFITVSTGIALFPGDAQDSSGLLRYAETAMHRAKELGGNGYCAYAIEMGRNLNDRLAMECDLRRAVEREELYLEYQPRIALDNFRVVGCEALLRWRCGRRGRISPGQFIPLAEETGLIVPLGRWVIDTAFHQAEEWRQTLASNLRVGVNISGIQLRASHADALLNRLIALNLADYRAVELELTESVLMDEPDRINITLGRARDLGIEIAIDDFGTGYSSLSYLKRFPIDRLKIDASFVRDVEYDASDAAIARAVIAIGHALGLKVVAEGVETEGQLRFLLAEGCDEAQGFLFSRPISADAVTRLLGTDQPMWTVPADWGKAGHGGPGAKPGYN